MDIHLFQYLFVKGDDKHCVVPVGLTSAPEQEIGNILLTSLTTMRSHSKDHQRDVSRTAKDGEGLGIYQGTLGINPSPPWPTHA